MLRAFQQQHAADGATRRRLALHGLIHDGVAALAVHATIKGLGITLGDSTDAYQANWRLAMTDLLTNRANDFDFREL